MPFLLPNQQCQSTEGTTAQNNHKKLKTGLVALYDIYCGNSAGLFSMKKTSKGGDKQGKSEEKG